MVSPRSGREADERRAVVLPRHDLRRRRPRRVARRSPRRAAAGRASGGSATFARPRRGRPVQATRGAALHLAAGRPPALSRAGRTAALLRNSMSPAAQEPGRSAKTWWSTVWRGAVHHQQAGLVAARRRLLRDQVRAGAR